MEGDRHCYPKDLSFYHCVSSWGTFACGSNKRKTSSDAHRYVDVKVEVAVYRFHIDNGRHRQPFSNSGRAT